MGIGIRGKVERILTDLRGLEDGEVDVLMYFDSRKRRWVMVSKDGKRVEFTEKKGEAVIKALGFLEKALKEVV